MQPSFDPMTVPTGWRSVYVRRCARVAFGTTASVGALFAAGTMAGDLVLHGLNGAYAYTGGFTALLLLAWPAGLVAYLLAGSLAARRLDRVLRRSIVPRAAERAMASRHARASWVLPLAASVLLVPYTAHFVVARLLVAQSPGGMDHWMVLSGPFAAPVFAYGLWVAWEFPRHLDLRRPVIGAALVGLFPLLFVSAGFAALTAIVVVLVALAPMRAIILRERAMGLITAAG